MASESPTTPLAVTCACGSVSGSVTIPTADLPLSLMLCHCSICRHQTGLLAGTFANLPSSIDHTDFKLSGATLTEYESSAVLSRAFCSRCGANLYVRAPDYTAICSGSLRPSPDAPSSSVELSTMLQSRIKLDCHIFVDSTHDGGLSTWLPKLPAWSGSPGSSTLLDVSDPNVSSPAAPSASTGASSKSLKAHCACRGVSFHITRPDATSVQPTNAPLSELFAPYNRECFAAAPAPSDPPLKLPIEENERDVKWWLSPLSPSNGEQQPQPTRYLAGTCVCASCRAYSGFEFQAWAFVPLSNIFPALPFSSAAPTEATGQVEFPPPATIPLTLPPPSDVLTTLKSYQSSPDVHRWFCGRCGATCFWQGKARPGVIDVSVGLLDATEEEGGGTRAANWLDWRWQRVGFDNEAEGWEGLNHLRDGLKAWGETVAKSS